MEVQAGRKATLVLASNVLGAGLGYVSLLLIGRYFEPSAYGAYLFAVSATGLLAFVSNLGIGAAHQRQVAQGLDPGRGLGVLVRLRLLVAAPLLGLLLAAYFGWAALHQGRPLTDATTPTVLVLALVLQVLLGSRQTLLDTWQGQQRVNRVETVRLVDTALVSVLLGNAALMVADLDGRWAPLPGIGAFWAHLLGLDGPLTLSQSAVLLASCYVLAKGASLLVAVAWAAGESVRIGPWDRGLAREYWRMGLPFALTGTLALVLQTTDATMLGFFWTAREVGLYGAAQRLATLGLLAANAVGPVLFTRFAQLHAAADPARADSLLRRSQRYLLLLTAPVVAAMVALPGAGLHVAVGDAYLGAALPLSLLALWACIVTLETPLASRLMGDGHTRLLVRSMGLNVGLNVVLNAVLIPHQGAGLAATGASLATVVSTAVGYSYVRMQARRLYGLPWVSADQVSIAAAAAATGLGWWAALRWLGPAWFDRAWDIAAWGVAGLAVYAAFLALLGQLHARDLRFLRHAAHPHALLAELRGR